QRGEALVEAGRTRDMAPGERVTGSRIVGDRGFVVTFRAIDPLFTLDLSDPSAPRVVAELKVPGFSTYLHPIEADHLLAIGTYVPEPQPGERPDPDARALQLAIFDVTNLAAPRQTHVELVGTAHGWSDAQFEHKAFNWFAARQLLAIPFSDWNPAPSDGADLAPWGGFTSELRVFAIDAVSGIEPRGAISMNDLYASQGEPAWDWYWSPQVRRSVMADDFVYAISDAGIRVADVDELSVPVATVLFEREPPR
ncbi:MAG: beta-propeller domain-containing protein, partial [Burkholderiales bacterium]